MQGDTILVIVLAVALLFSENPMGQVEYFGFPVAYIIAGALLLYGLDMRKAIRDERRLTESVPLSQLRSWNDNAWQARTSHSERMRRT